MKDTKTVREETISFRKKYNEVPSLVHSGSSPRSFYSVIFPWFSKQTARVGSNSKCTLATGSASLGLVDNPILPL